MSFHLRPRRLVHAALTVALVVLVAACAQDHPESVFHQRTDFNRDVDFLFRLIIWVGVAVFVFVEAVLVVALIKFRQRPNQPEPEHVHGNTTLEIAWTIIPALILIIIAIPTVRTIFRTQAKARSDALQVEVIGHQWWWEFRYPQYTARGANGKTDTLVTANELYLPLGRTANFTLKTADVLHSFWIPALGGKRDLISNHTNYLWFTPDSATSNAWNGTCVEYCGTSHGNMRFKAFTVAAADFDSWVAHQLTAATGSAVPAADSTANRGPTTTAAAQIPTPAANKPGAGVPAAPAPPAPQLVQAGFISFPRENIPDYARPKTPLPDGLAFDDNLKGDPANGAKLFSSSGTCIACHTIRGTGAFFGVTGPNLTHVASRTTIAAGLYPNDAQHLARWIKNARVMKPGVIMPTLGTGQYDPVLKGTMKAGLTDQQIADVVAYLQTLK
jgi:cytochrome c oxidase subunit 2